MVVGNATLGGTARSVATSQYVLMAQEGIVTDSVGRNMLRLEASLKSKSQTRKF